MPSTSRRCKHCNKGGAYSFNDLCMFHWNELIDLNIKKVIANEQKKKPL